jgi:hypothetical protein
MASTKSATSSTVVARARGPDLLHQRSQRLRPTGVANRDLVASLGEEPGCGRADFARTDYPDVHIPPAQIPSSVAISSSESLSPAAATFSSRCATEEVPGMGSIADE